MMDIVILLSVFALVCFGIGDTIGAYLSRHITSPRLMMMDTLVGLFLYNIIIFFSSVTWVVPTTTESLYLIGLSLGTLLGTIALFQGLSTGKAGIVVPIANSYALVSVFLGVFVLGESLSWLQIGAVIIILGGLFFLSFDIKDLKKSDRSVMFGFLALLMWGMMTFFAELATQTMHPFVVVAYNNILMLSFVSGYLICTKQLFIKGIERKYIAWGITMSTLFALGFLAFVTGFSLGSLSIVAVIAAASPFITAVLAHKFLGDKITVFQYYMIAVVIGGIMLLVW